MGWNPVLCAWQAALHPLNSVPSPVANVMGRPCSDIRSDCICSHTGKQARVFSSHVLLWGHWLAYLNDSLWWEKRPPALSLPFSEPLWWRNGAQMWEGLPSGFIQPVQGRLSLFVCLFFCTAGTANLLNLEEKNTNFGHEFKK